MRTDNSAAKQLIALIFATALALPSPVLAKEPLPVPGPAIVMFWAPWCAPCREELRDYPTLSRVSTVPVMVIALDTGRDQRPLLGGIPQDRLRVINGPSVGHLSRWSPDTVGLPLSVGIDAKGSICASHLTRLDVQALNRLIAFCQFGR